MFNRLANETSPSLLQHADNPVDWYPLGEKALERARTEDKPIFLSIGYSACHWCHVMAHESFEDADTAAVMNEHFVNVKVDREERPDLDRIYMSAVQALTGGDLVLLHEFRGHTEEGQVLVFTPATLLGGIQIVRIVTLDSPSWVSWKEIEVIGETGRD